MVIGALTAYLGVSVAGDLLSAASALSTSPEDLSPTELARMERRLRSAADRFGGVAGRILKAIPFVRQNIAVVETAVVEAAPVLDAAGALKARLDDAEAGGLLAEGRFRLDVVAGLRGPLADVADALSHAGRALREQRNGWLLPPLWSVADRTVDELEGFAAEARDAEQLTTLSNALFGGSGRRRYLIVLLNNAELRGAGGIPSAVGILNVIDGRLSLGRFRHTVALRGPRPHFRVPAPSDFRERFGYYDADTTLWVNTTMSPDVPDVALVARRLFEHSTGVRTDGVILVDPRGIAALLPPDATMEAPGTDRTITPADFASFVYSDAYELLGGQSERRRDALLELGRAAFEIVIDQGLRTRADLVRAAGAVDGGHLRFVSFDGDETRGLAAVDASGDLSPPASDSVLVAVQDFGSGKLGFWVRERIRHACDVEPDTATCVTVATLSNRAPDGLSRYVDPHGALRSFVEVYVPQAARLSAVRLDGEPAEFYRQEQDGHAVIGMLLDVGRGEERSVEVTYALDLTDGYELVVRPQPLPHDAQLELAISAPGGWAIEGPGGSKTSPHLRYEGPLDDTLRVAAAPDERTGISALWAKAVRFWREPLF